MGIYLSSILAIIHYDEEDYENFEIKSQQSIKKDWLVVKEKNNCIDSSNSWGFYEDIEQGLYD